MTKNSYGADTTWEDYEKTPLTETRVITAKAARVCRAEKPQKYNQLTIKNMTRKHFIAIANILAGEYQRAEYLQNTELDGESYFQGKKEGIESVAEHLAGYFKEENVDFDYEKFMTSIIK